MHILLPLLIVAAQAVPGTAPPADATELLRCGFEAENDLNFDAWPDGWTRQRGRGFPHYVVIEIVGDPPAAGGQCLRVNVNGGTALAQSPLIEIEPLRDYLLLGSIRAEGLQHNQALLRLTFYDEQEQPLAEFESPAVQNTQGWTTLRLGPVATANPHARYVRIGLCVKPGEEAEDFAGTVWFDELWLGRLPQMMLTLDPPHLLLPLGQPVRAACRVAGFHVEQPRIRWELFSALDEAIAASDVVVEPEQPQLAGAAPAAAHTARTGPTPVGQRAAYSRWQVPLSAPGFYRLRATLLGEGTATQVREAPLAVIEPAELPARSEFGWTLPADAAAWDATELASLLRQAGVGRVKIPLWPDGKDSAHLDHLAWFIERLQTQGVEIVGVLAHPPREARQLLALAENAQAADVFGHQAELWFPSLQPVMNKLGLKIRAWQLGDDFDTSFVGHADLAARMAGVRQVLAQSGQPEHLGFGWGWLDEPPHLDGPPVAGSRVPPWTFLARVAVPPLAPPELDSYLEGTQETAVQDWVILSPLDPDRYGTQQRAADLVRRMVAAKARGASGIFFSPALADRSGLLNAAGQAQELLLPWRTTALALAGTKHVGRMWLPGGSHNEVFARDGQAVMVIWNDLPAQEVLYLGPRATLMDPWGRRSHPEPVSGGHLLRVGPMPLFAAGLDAGIIGSMLSLSLARDKLPCIFGAAHENALRIKNRSHRPLVGTVRLVLPDNWKAQPEILDVSLAPGEQGHLPFEVVFPPSASCGTMHVQLEFDVATDVRHRFTMVRELELGLGDLEIELSSRLLDDGTLEVEQRFINRSPQPVSFRCYLLAPNRRRMRTHVLRLPPGDNVQVYRFRQGAELVGRTLWLRAEELDGSRTLNYRYVVEP
jgi:hypothetical protein